MTNTNPININPYGHIYLHQSPKLSRHRLAGHCPALTQIMPILCLSEDVCVSNQGTSVLQGPTTSLNGGRFHSRPIHEFITNTPPIHPPKTNMPTTQNLSFLVHSAHPPPVQSVLWASRTLTTQLFPIAMHRHQLTIHWHRSSQSVVSPYGHFVNTWGN